MQYNNQDNQLKVTKTKYNEDGSTYETEVLYTKEFLTQQVEAITAQRDEMIALKQAELDEVNLLLDKCVELGVTETEVTE